jgi:hypothetical protein
MNIRFWKKGLCKLVIACMIVTTFAGSFNAFQQSVQAEDFLLEPSADAHVDGGSGSAANQSVNYDAPNPPYSQLSLKEDSNTSSQYPYTRRVLMRFDLSTLPDPAATKSVKLKVFASAAATSDTIQVYAVEDDSWQENTVTWLTKPGYSEMVNSFELGTAAGYYEVDLTSYMKQQKLGDGHASIMLINTSDRTRQIYSKERTTATQRPVLVVEQDTAAPVYQSVYMNNSLDTVNLVFDEPIVDATNGLLKDEILFTSNDEDFVSLEESANVSINGDTLSIQFENPISGTLNRVRVLANALKDESGNVLASVTTSGLLSGEGAPPENENNRVFTPIADSGVDSGLPNVNANYGNASTVALKEGGGLYNRRFYAKFDISTAKNFNSAKLRIHFTSADVSSNLLSVYAVADDTWTESGLTYANQPLALPTPELIVGQTLVGGVNGWYEWDLSAYVQEQASGDQQVSLMLLGSDTSSNRIVSMKENAANAPQLVLHYDESAPEVEEMNVAGENKSITITFNEKIQMHTLNEAALKAGIQLARDDNNWAPLDELDEVSVMNDQLVIQLHERLAMAGAKLKLDANLLQDEHGNILDTEWVSDVLSYDVAAPVMNTAGVLDPTNKIFSIGADELLFPALNDQAQWKAGVMYAEDGEDFEALEELDTLSFSGGELVVTKSQKFASGSKLKIAGNTVKDGSGNVAVADWISQSITADISAPEIEGAYVINFNKKAVLVFNESIAVHELNEEELKAAIKRSSNGGSQYMALGAQDQVKLSANTMTIILEQPLQGGDNRFQIDANTIKDLSGNIAGVLESGLIESKNATYPYAPPSEHYLKEAMNDSISVLFGNQIAATGSQPETMAAGALATIAMAIASGDREPAYIDRYVSTIKKAISIEANMPNLMGGLDSRQHSPLIYAIAILWNDQEIMSRFTEAERSKLVTMLKAGLISTAYTLSDFDKNDNP